MKWKRFHFTSYLTCANRGLNQGICPSSKNLLNCTDARDAVIREDRPIVYETETEYMEQMGICVQVKSRSQVIMIKVGEKRSENILFPTTSPFQKISSTHTRCLLFRLFFWQLERRRVPWYEFFATTAVLFHGRHQQETSFSSLTYMHEVKTWGKMK